MATTLRTRIEAAGAAYLKAQLPTANVYPGLSSEDDLLPKIVFSVRSMAENPYRSGNFDVTCMIEVKWHADAGSETGAEALLASVQNAIWISDLEAQLVAAATEPLAVFGCTGPLKTEYSNSDDIWVATITLELNGCIRSV